MQSKIYRAEYQKKLKKRITSEISRGVSQAMRYSDITGNLNNVSQIGLRKASRIVRTEGHRIQQASSYDAQLAAKDAGADIFKQWDATLDGATRDTHRKLDGQIVAIDEPFEVEGMQAMYPSDFGDPSEDCNCRCVSLQRARWELDESDLATLKERAEYFELDKTKNFEDFSTKYLIASKGLGVNNNFSGIPKHKEPIVIEHIDFNDEKMVKSVIDRFEKEAINESIETACVIAKDGTVYKCFGIEDRVFPDSDLGDTLIGSKVSHNHLMEYTSFTFSKDDANMFDDYSLEILHGCDKKYTYELNRNSQIIDDEPDDWMTFENYEHSKIIKREKETGIGYRRWENG